MLKKKLSDFNITTVDLILASDVLYHPSQLPLIPIFLNQLTDVLDQSYSPTIILSYKSRHEELDNQLFDIFDSFDFDGEQASAEELHEPYLCEPIDIFILHRKGKEVSVNFPKASNSD